jgi:hypothetical protein
MCGSMAVTSVASATGQTVSVGVTRGLWADGAGSGLASVAAPTLVRVLPAIFLSLLLAIADFVATAPAAAGWVITAARMLDRQRLPRRYTL